jgi:dihydrofolate synthase/folylpolyglutamate synthase
MELKDFKNYANSFQAIARLELESITLLLDFLGHPEKNLNFIHVAGTNGKGSVCAFLQEIFSNAGYRCGKYISPNMVSVCERVSIDGREITEAELSSVLDTVQRASDMVAAKLGGPPTQFEIWTAAAFCYFKEKKCDMVILETGLGGCRDATNVIPPPKASVITRIAMDHTAYLGGTLTEITEQKAGIIKKHADGKTGMTVTLNQCKEVMNKLKSECSIKNNALIVTEEPVINTPEGMCEVFSYKSFKNLKIGIAGFHQIENACIAVETAMNFGVSEAAIRKGLKNAGNIGRFELLRESPPLVFDGAHNPDGMRSLVFGLKRYFPDIKPVFVMGMMADKDVSGTLDKIKEA